MSKRKKDDSQQAGWGLGYVVDEHCPNYLIGCILTQLDILGLPEKQSQALYDLIRQKIWDTFHYEGVLIMPERHAEIRLANIKQKEGARIVGVPPSVV